jgi:hypothetical protein
MKKPRNHKGVLEMVLVIAAIFLIPLFFAIKSLATPQVADTIPTQIEVTDTPKVVTTATAQGPSVATKPSATVAVAQGKQPPACAFPLAQLPAVETKTDDYSFSDLKVVRTAEKGNLFEIAEWLPDNQQVLMTEQLRNVQVAEGTSHQERIELFDPTRGTSKLYAVRALTHENPVWIPSLNVVVYPEIDYYNYTPTAGTYTAVRKVFVSGGNPDSVDLLVDNLQQIPFALRPGGGTLLFFTKNSLSKLNTTLQGSGIVDFDPSQWDYATTKRNKLSVSFEMVWQPGTPLIFIYSDGAMGGGGYTYVLNADNGTICQLDLGGWALKAHWSSDGRYLAIIQATNYSFPIPSARLAVMDSVTGNVSLLVGVPQGTDEYLDVDDFVWAPDNQHLLALGSVYPSIYDQSGNKTHGLYLIDLASGQGVHVIEEYKASVSPQDGNMAWSPNGKMLILRCPGEGNDRICLLQVRSSHN